MAMMRTLLSKSRVRGITLLETMLGLAIGALAIFASVEGMNRYTESVQVQASAGQLQRVIAAADTWATDHYETIAGAGPRIYTPAQTQTALDPYLGGMFPQDAFRNQYRLATRTYNYNVPDPATGGNITRQAIQVLVVGFNATPGSPLASDADLRVNIANTAGRGAGFVTNAFASCSDGTPTGRMAAGNICGAFGTYALLANRFPAGALASGFVVGLVTKGDSSFYGDQLYRYNYGDPDLNTMRTTLFMDSRESSNDIQSPRRALNLRTQAPGAGSSAVIVGADAGTTGTGVERGDIILDPGTSNRVVISTPNATTPAELISSSRTLLLGNSVQQSLVDSTNATRRTTLGDGQMRTSQVFSALVGTDEVSSLWRRADTPLRLQRFNRGEVIIGNRGRYSPNNQGVNDPNLRYEISDGRLVAGHIVSQDVTCADCGGSLSQILPRWRHMGTYFVGYTRGAGSRVPHPSCGDTRRGRVVRNATSGTGQYQETHQDQRYRPAILLIPRQIRSKSVDESNVPSDSEGRWADVPIDAHFRAEQVVNGTGVPQPFWNVVLHKPSDNVYSTAFALTYCVFTGGDSNATDPTTNTIPGFFGTTPAGMGTWTTID